MPAGPTPAGIIGAMFGLDERVILGVEFDLLERAGVYEYSVDTYQSKCPTNRKGCYIADSRMPAERKFFGLTFVPSNLGLA